MKKIKLDSEQSKWLKFWVLSVTLMSVFTLFIFLPGNQSKLAEYKIVSEALMITSIVALTILVLMIVVIIILQLKGSRGKLDADIIFRDPSKIFNFKKPETVVETIVLYQDYTSQVLSKNLYDKTTCGSLFYAMFEKQGWIKKDGDDILILDGVNNKFFKKFCVEPLDKMVDGIKVAEDLNKQEYFTTKFQEQPGPFKDIHTNIGEENKTIIVYHFKALSEYYKIIKAAMTVVATEICKKHKNVMDFNKYSQKIGCAYVNSPTMVDVVEKENKNKFYSCGNNKPFLLKVFLIIILGTFIFNFIFSSIYAPMAGERIAIYFQFSTKANTILYWYSLILSCISAYIFLLRRECSEKLNDKGKKLLNNVQGLKNFIEQYTQLKNPSSDNLFRVWDEFVLFANIFGLNSKLYEVAKDNGIFYDNEEIFDYFGDNECFQYLLKINNDACRVPFVEVSDHKYRVKYQGQEHFYLLNEKLGF